ncbi:MAG TPA: DUF4286 family protein [Sphingobacteriaceae bacterium]
MILYNITIIIDDAIERDWVSYIQGSYIPQIMGTGAFVSNRLLKVLDSPNEGYTYCLQFIAEDLSKYHNFQNDFFAPIQAAHQQQFENKFVSFSTIMEYVDTI